MRFLPASSISKSPSSSSVDSHSILRVPSLNSSSGVSDGRHAEMSEREEDSLTESTRNRSHLPESKGPPHRRNSYSSRYQSAVWATSPSGGGRVYQGPPGFVNYIPEEMNLTSDGWQLASAQNLPSQGTWIISQNSTSSPPQQHGMPPYSPIRIRSARGGTRRLPVSGSSSTSTPHVTSQSEASPSRSFPVSNRGMGRCRNVATTLPVKGNASSNDEVVMLAKPDASTVCSTMDLTAVKRDKRPEVKLPRSVVQRKLPLMSGTAADLPRS